MYKTGNFRNPFSLFLLRDELPFPSVLIPQKVTKFERQQRKKT
jgi:hypothetical protein